MLQVRKHPFEAIVILRQSKTQTQAQGLDGVEPERSLTESDETCFAPTQSDTKPHNNQQIFSRSGPNAPTTAARVARASPEPKVKLKSVLGTGPNDLGSNSSVGQY